jgi:DNA repair exonuclease SbcCD ATPase subunit
VSNLARSILLGNTSSALILDDRSISIFDVPGDEFAENDYGVVITSSSESNQLKQNIHQLAQAALQNQTLKFSDLLYIFNTSSLSDIRRRIEKSESDLANQQAQAQQAQQQQAQQAQQLAEAKAQREEAREDTKLQLEAQKIELDRLKLQLDSQLHQMELNIKEGIDNAKIKADISKTEAEIALKQKELEETIRSNKANERKINK